MMNSEEEMFEALWSFLQRNPQGYVPFPWERCYDTPSDMLYYKNIIDGTMMVDLRNKVIIDGALYHTNDCWNFIAGGILNCNNYHYYRNLSTELESPIVIRASCCGPRFYLVAPEKIHFCPICDSFISYQDSPNA